MKHAGPAALLTIEPLLIELRRLESLREPKPGTFYWKSSAFVHFHEDPAGMFADLRHADGWTRLPVNTAAECSRLVHLATQILSEK